MFLKCQNKADRLYSLRNRIKVYKPHKNREICSVSQSLENTMESFLVWEFLQFILDTSFELNFFSCVVSDNYCVIGQNLKWAWLLQKTGGLPISLVLQFLLQYKIGHS